MPTVIAEGDRFRLTRDWRGQGSSKWKSGRTGAFRCVVPKGTIIVARQDVDNMAVGFVATPESYAELETVLVPEEERSDADYDGYSFVFFTGDVGALLEKVDP